MILARKFQITKTKYTKTLYRSTSYDQLSVQRMHTDILQITVTTDSKRSKCLHLHFLNLKIIFLVLTIPVQIFSLPTETKL
jgi:hypothetical protein